MDQRLKLQTYLESLLETDNVYFQPPTNVTLSYPCVVYKRDDSKDIYAENEKYKQRWGYQISVIDRNPDSSFVKTLAENTNSVFIRSFVAGGLHHDIFNLYF